MSNISPSLSLSHFINCSRYLYFILSLLSVHFSLSFLSLIFQMILLFHFSHLRSTQKPATPQNLSPTLSSPLFPNSPNLSFIFNNHRRRRNLSPPPPFLSRPTTSPPPSSSQL
ncbi:hypothetical protein HanIR_Chr11g0541571 [Helianthus annuus]|nr:hypothetical protein HanIR_Chr11g0541571 [Helianthus annuus]